MAKTASKRSLRLVNVETHGRDRIKSIQYKLLLNKMEEQCGITCLPETTKITRRENIYKYTYTHTYLWVFIALGIRQQRRGLAKKWVELYTYSSSLS